MSEILNFGSLNIDRVFRVGHIVAPGETIASKSLTEFAGGKGANQSVALARAGARVAHFGRIGPDGKGLLEKLAAEGVDVRWVRVGSAVTGQAIIQVEDGGQNAIVLLRGANADITTAEVEAAIVSQAPGSWLLVQNETSGVSPAIEIAHRRGLKVAFNPAPFDEMVLRYPLDLVDLLCVNAIEGAALTGEQPPERIIAALAARLPNCEIVLTLGRAGALCRSSDETLRAAAAAVTAVDTTAAGDTFLGYYLASRMEKLSPAKSLIIANRAAAICVTRPGAIDSIPRRAELND